MFCKKSQTVSQRRGIHEITPSCSNLVISTDAISTDSVIFEADGVNDFQSNQPKAQQGDRGTQMP